MRGGLIVAALVISVPAFSQGNPQFQYDLATTYDGSVLYFSAVVSSTNPNTKIYSWSRSAGLALFGDRPDLMELPPYFGEHLYGTQITYEGSVLYHAEQLCATGTGPGFNTCDNGQTQVVIPSLPQFTLSGFLLISPFGRYGVAVPYKSGGLWMDWFTGQQIEVDFKGQIVPNVSPPFYVNQHAVANNGSFLITVPGAAGVRVWSPTGEIVLPTGDYLMNASISADGSTVALNPFDHTLGDVRSPTYVYNLAALATNPAAKPVAFPQFVSMSDDGQTVAYLAVNGRIPSNLAQAMVSHADGTGARQITNLPYGASRVLLSGDARYLFVVAYNGDNGNDGTQIQRYELATGVVDTVPVVP
jgi:hypothetical protein